MKNGLETVERVVSLMQSTFNRKNPTKIHKKPISGRRDKKRILLLQKNHGIVHKDWHFSVLFLFFNDFQHYKNSKPDALNPSQFEV